jgi:S1-C subfamily serine protease
MSMCSKGPSEPPVVCQLKPGGPGDRAGLMDGDVVLAHNGKAYATYRELADAIQEIHRRDGREPKAFTLRVRRGEKEIEVRVEPEVEDKK